MYQVEDADYKSKNTLEIVEYWYDYLSQALNEYRQILDNNNHDAISQIHVYLLIKYRDNISCTAGSDSFKTELGKRFRDACKTLKLSSRDVNKLLGKISYKHEENKNRGISTHFNIVNEEINEVISNLTERFGRGKSYKHNKQDDILDYIKSKNSLFEDNHTFLDIPNTNFRICLMEYNEQTPGLTNKETYNKLFYGEEVTDIDGNILEIPQDNLIWLETKPEVKSRNNEEFTCFDKYEINQYCIARNKYTREPAPMNDSNGKFRVMSYGITKSPYVLALETFSNYNLEDRVVKDNYANHTFVFKSREELYNPNKLNFNKIGAFKCNDEKIYIFLNATSFSHAITNIPNMVKTNYSSNKYLKYNKVNLKEQDIAKIKDFYTQYYLENHKEDFE